MVWKKIIALLICLQFALMPVLASGELTISDYDFSDNAQQEFNQNRFTPVLIQETSPANLNNFKREREKKEIKTTKDNTPEMFKPETQPFYIPPEIVSTPVFQGSVVNVPAGTPLVLTFDSGVSSGSLEKNDRITATLSEDWIYNRHIIAPKGSLVYGVTTNASTAGNAYKSGSIELSFNQILAPDGNQININTEKIIIAEENGSVKYMARDILVGAGIGILTGALFALLGDGNYVSAMAVTGGIGMLGGGMRGYSNKGINVQIPDGTKLETHLTSPINVSPYH